MAFADIQVGIPSMLLCIEMFLFSLLHIIAFPWRPYDIRRNPDPAVYYRGGVGGWRALMDAFNPWDIIKASARGFRWLFVGRRHRPDGSSQETTLENIKAGGPTNPLSGGAEDGRDGRPAFKRQDSDSNEDQARLLSNAQDVPNTNEPSARPFRDASPHSNFQKEVNRYDDESDYHTVPDPEESTYEGQQYSGVIATRFPETSYDPREYTTPSPVGTPSGVRPPARLPGDEADLGYHGDTGGMQEGERR